ncbi:lipopolysaccharide export system permease protein [Ekhidna lutea]|uniref:Lipopolysaccharide export system permease protein n=1 Tax=Ekhidna lutea TaxID=447679 RepID=A0A239HVJ0_EKHLU|nr:LptF/LptG family permease [Ekhidna lutea]SNS85329.1 lipopolysaccharide export system permease protein [Ekhidna lutea]
MRLKKLDVLMLRSFVGPLVLTTAVANFILLIQYLLKYFDDFVGKNLGFTVFAELLFYFSLNMLQIALPLGVLLASLMTFGNLGENFELTAIKSSGISLLRTLRPIFLFVVGLSIGAYFFNNYTIPAANLKAYSLLYDIKHTKPALDIKAGAFYNGIPNYSIKAKDKLPDGKTLLDVIIYDHSLGRGNKTVILADSSLMYTIMDDRYLKLEMYNGHYYSEEQKTGSNVDRFYRTEYARMDMVFSLSSFDLKRRKEELFQNNRQMKNISELSQDVDSFKIMVIKQKANLITGSQRYFLYHLRNKDHIREKSKVDKDSVSTEQADNMVEASLIPLRFFQQQKPAKTKMVDQDSIEKVREELLLKEDVFLKRKPDEKPRAVNRAFGNRFEFGSVDTLKWVHLDTYLEGRLKNNKPIISDALNKARNVKVNINSAKTRLYQYKKDVNLYTIEMQKKYALALACILMFLIGAPLGAIIKKGGLGVPTILAIFFFIIYYLFMSIGEKQAKEGAMDPYLASWMADMILLPFGLFFLRQARVDARIFEIDAYRVGIEKLRRRFARNKNKA